MVHDFSLVFDTENPLWKNVLEIFKRNESYPKKCVKGRSLHHKFPRSFSKLLNEDVDNDSDNLVSLPLADHFMIHYITIINLEKTNIKQRWLWHLLIC